MFQEPLPQATEQPGATTVTCFPVLHQSLSLPYQASIPPVERAGFTTITTPIDALAATHLLPFLRTHGATVEAVGDNQVYLALLPSGKRRARTFKTYRITFPAGLRRLDGLSTSVLVPFTLVFPDGAQLEGRINTIPDPEEILLGLPGTQKRSQNEQLSPPLSGISSCDV